MTDTAFRNLTQKQFDDIVSAGSMDGKISVCHGATNYGVLMDESRVADIDPRVALAGMLFEDHFGTDPNGGIALAKVYNFGGIKWAGQPGATDSGIDYPHSEGPNPMGTYSYAAFANLGAFVAELYRTLNNQYCGPWFRAGDLRNAWSVYVTGRVNSATGQERVDQLDYYRTKYPADDVLPEGAGVYGDDLIAKFRTQIGRSRSGNYDVRNGDHAWAYWCEAGVESTGRQCGLVVSAWASALANYQQCADQGLIQSGVPEHGALVFLGLAFYAPDGHVGLWDADRGQLLSTQTDGTGVGYRDWGAGTIGYLGWARMPGVVGPRRATEPLPAPKPADTNLVIPGNPYNTRLVAPYEVGVGGAFKERWIALDAVALMELGFPVENERQAHVVEQDGRTVAQRTVQRFERGWRIFVPENDGAWRVVAPLVGQQVIPIGGGA